MKVFPHQHHYWPGWKRLPRCAAEARSWLSDDGGCGYMWMVAAGAAQRSMKPHALGSPFALLGPKNYQK